MRHFLDKYGLLVAILLGTLPVFRLLTPALPYLLFVMLFFTFCKVRPQDLRLCTWHYLALLAQLVLAFGSYLTVHYAYRIWDFGITEPLAQALMLCFLMPSATAAPIITGKLGGSIRNLTTYTVLSNFSTVLIAPVFFAFVNPDGAAFGPTALAILQRVSTVLVGPLLAAWLMQWLFKKTAGFISNQLKDVSFYVWMFTIMILMSNITHTLVHGTYSAWTAVLICLGATLACLVQFMLGHAIGRRFPAPDANSRITAGQALGQKNTTLAIWMAHTCLMPLVALGPAIYMIVQNLYNSAQLRAAAKARESASNRHV